MNLVNDRVPVIRGERDISNRVAHTYWERGYSSAGLWVIREFLVSY